MRININWKHGINALPVEKHNQLGRISIIFWGWSDLVEDVSGSDETGEIEKAEAFQRICKQFQIHGKHQGEWKGVGWEHDNIPRLDEDSKIGCVAFSRNVLLCPRGQWLIGLKGLQDPANLRGFRFLGKHAPHVRSMTPAFQERQMHLWRSL